MSNFSVSYHDEIEHAIMSAEHVTTTPDCAPYFTVKIGDLTIFMNPPRLREFINICDTALRDVEAREDEARREHEAEMREMEETGADRCPSRS